MLIKLIMISLSYYRRLIHNAFVNDPEIMTESAKGDLRFKRVTLKKRVKG